MCHRDLFERALADSPGSGLSGAQLAAIIVGSVVALVLLGGLLFWFLRRRRKTKKSEIFAGNFPTWARDGAYRFEASYTVKGDDAPQSASYSLTFQQGTFEGDGRGGQGYFTVTNGVINGSDITWKQTMPNGSKLCISEFQGSVVDDTTITGSFKVCNGLKSSRFTMIRLSKLSELLGDADPIISTPSPPYKTQEKTVQPEFMV